MINADLVDGSIKQQILKGLKPIVASVNTKYMNGDLKKCAKISKCWKFKLKIKYLLLFLDYSFFKFWWKIEILPHLIAWKYSRWLHNQKWRSLWLQFRFSRLGHERTTWRTLRWNTSVRVCKCVSWKRQQGYFRFWSDRRWTVSVRIRKH